MNATGSALTCANTWSTTSNPSNAYVAILKISELTEDDQNHMHNLTITNRIGTTSYSVRIQTIEGNTITPSTVKDVLLPFPIDIIEISVGLTTGAIAGIVVGCIVGVVLIAGAILLFIRLVNFNSTVF